MLRKTFETEIQQVKDNVIMLGSMVEQAIINSVETLKKRDIKAAEQILKYDSEINKKRFDIENQLMILIATQQPMAHDLRLLASTMEIISELERMGDYAKGIANINVRMGDEPLLKPLIDIPRMAQKGADMLHRALTAFINEDVDAANVGSLGLGYSWLRPQFGIDFLFQVDNVWDVPYRMIERRPMPGRGFDLGMKVSL